MARFSLTTRINATPARAFSVFSDLHNADQRVSGIKKLQVLTDGPIGKGTRFRETRTMFGKDHTEEMEIIDFQPDRSYTVFCSSCGAESSCKFQFRPEGAATVVEMEMLCKPVSFMAKLMSPLMIVMMGSMRKCMQKEMEELRAAAERSNA